MQLLHGMTGTRVNFNVLTSSSCLRRLMHKIGLQEVED